MIRFVPTVGPGRRGVSPIIATILLIAISTVLAAVLYVLISGMTTAPGATPLGSALVYGTATEGSAGGTYWYNFTIESSSKGLDWNDMALEVRSQGTVVAMGATTTWTVYSLAGATICSSTGSVASGWAAGTVGSGTTPVTSAETLSVQSPTSVVDQADQLYALGLGAYSGTVQAKIP